MPADVTEALHIPTHLTPEAADFSRAIGFVDGQIVPLDQARLPVRDLGLMYADMTYDVVHSWRGGFFRLVFHVDGSPSSYERLSLGTV